MIVADEVGCVGGKAVVWFVCPAPPRAYPARGASLARAPFAVRKGRLLLVRLVYGDGLVGRAITRVARTGRLRNVQKGFAILGFARRSRCPARLDGGSVR